MQLLDTTQWESLGQSLPKEDIALEETLILIVVTINFLLAW